MRALSWAWRSSASPVRDRQSGQALVLVALMLVALLGIVGLVIDGGNAYLTNRRLQSAADLAALGGASTLKPGGPTVARSTALGLAATNTAPETVVTVVNTPPTSGAYAGNTSTVEVIISRNVKTAFARVLGIEEIPVTARAVALIGLASSPYAVLALSTNASPAIDIAGGGSFITEGAGIMANSTSSNAIKHTSGGYVDIDGPVNAVGGINVGGIIADVIQSGAPSFPDPLAYLGHPDRTGLANLPGGVSVSGSTTCVPSDYRPSPPTPSNCRTFRSGVYNGGIKITGGDWVFEPGAYILTGDGMQITNGNVTGHGVFFYNTVDSDNKSGPIMITTSGTVILSPITTEQRGMPANLIFYQDRAVSATNKDMQIAATASTNIRGTIYIPTNRLSITGGGETGVVDGQIIASTVKLGGGSNKTVVYHPDSIAYNRGGTLVE